MPLTSKTKEAFANALKDTMRRSAFEKVTVSYLCKSCNMQRKTFYYHFSDKYELMNWIFQTEVIEPLAQKQYNQFQEFIRDLLLAIEADRKFYTSAFRMEHAIGFGDAYANSFQIFFIDCMKPFIRKYHRRVFRASAIVPRNVQEQYFEDCIGGAIMCNVQQWLLAKPKLSAAVVYELYSSTNAF